MSEPDVEIGRIGVFGGDRGGQLVLLILQDERKLEFIAHAVKVEFSHDRMAHPIVKAVRRGHEAERNDRLGDADRVEQFQRRRMERSGALILDRRRFLLEHGDGNAALVERERAYHADRPGADHDDPRVWFLSRHRGE